MSKPIYDIDDVPCRPVASAESLKFRVVCPHCGMINEKDWHQESDCHKECKKPYEKHLERLQRLGERADDTLPALPLPDDSEGEESLGEG